MKLPMNTFYMNIDQFYYAGIYYDYIYILYIINNCIYIYIYIYMLVIFMFRSTLIL